MSLRSFLWDNTLAIIFNTVGLIAAAVFVGLTGGPFPAAIVAIVWAAALIVYFGISYYLLKRKIARLKKTADNVHDKVLLSEVVPSPEKNIDKLYYELMLMHGRAAIERTVESEKEKSDYYEYLMQWVHEIKTPISAAMLVCGNNKSEDFHEIARQLSKINNCAEQVLYEVRSNNVGRDLLIRETDLSALVKGCINENKRLFIDAGISISNDAEGCAFADEKWLGFALRQILYNSVQYAKSENAGIKISTVKQGGEKLQLVIRDNGIGIPESDLPRIFEKGYTGDNGRRNKKATGMGLYLCKKMCDAMDIGLTARSVCGEYTEIIFTMIEVK